VQASRPATGVHRAVATVVCAVLVALVLWQGSVPAGAQADTTPAPESGPTTVIPTTPPPTTAPVCVPTPAETDVVFLGVMIERTGDAVRFEVRSVQQGPELPNVVTVSFPKEAQYFDRGNAYRVTATPTPEGGYTGRVEQPEGFCYPLTLTATGEPIDTSVFGGFFSRWPSILWALFVPLAAVLVVLLVVVGLKRLVVWAFR
jgi:hypothetical protein